MLWRLSDRIRHRARLRRGNAAHAWGSRGEDLAHRFLQKLGYRVVARNWRAEDGSGELDLVAWDGPTLVVIEVKTRATSEHGSPEESIDAVKRRHLIRTAVRYAREADVSLDRMRFDIVSVLFEKSVAIEHVKGAFARPL